MMPAHPHLLHDKGTLEVMLGNYSKAVGTLREAMESSGVGFRRLMSASEPTRTGCTEEANLKANVFLTWDKRYLISSSNMIYRIPEVSMYGDAGIVVPNSNCDIFVPASDPFVSLSSNLPMMVPSLTTRAVAHEPWKRRAPRPPQPSRHNKVFSLMQYHSSAFYHWICECLTRLVMAKEFLIENADIRVLVPEGPEVGKFVRESLTQFFPWLTPNRIAGYYQLGPDANFKRAQVSLYHFVHWAESADGSHALANPLALRRLHAEISHPEEPQDGPKTIIVLRRGHVVMRNFPQESDILRYLERRSESGSRFRVVTFDGSQNSLVEARTLFGKASAIVGLHGGGLSNIIFCPKGVKVLEIGFPCKCADHYQHVATTIGLNYSRVFVEGDVLFRGLTAPNVTVSDSLLKAALDKLIQSIAMENREE
eukprot:PhF_6_TR41331/c1_g1_i2/m.62665